jgi:ABC-2 type transport system ATP-binding protein
VTVLAPAASGPPLVLPETALPLIRVADLSKRFPVARDWRAMLRHPTAASYKQALSHVTLDIAPGEFFGFLGPNGAGKSTLFRILATLIEPDGGQATVDGADIVRDAHAVRRRIALVSTDERSLNWRLSAHENLRFFAALHGLRGGALRSRVGEVLALVDLLDVGERMVGGFSSGMKQRLLIARALLPAPRILLLDEPTRSLDPIAARRFRAFLRTELTEQQGCTVLLATHNSEEALLLCDRVAVLAQGRIVAVGAPRELSQQLGTDRFQVWTRDAAHPVFDALVRAGRITGSRHVADDQGWAVVEFVLPELEGSSAEVLATLVQSGLVVARFEKVQPALADVIEQFVHRLPPAGPSR